MSEKESKTSTAKKKTAGKKERDLKAKLKQVQDELDAVNDRLLRTAAELDNMRKRTEREKEYLVLNANEGLIRDLLPIADDMHRSLEASGKSGGKDLRSSLGPP